MKDEAIPTAREKNEPMTTHTKAYKEANPAK